MVSGNSAREDFFRYRGRSMWPCFQEGDLLEIQPVVLAELRVGDCITYQLNDHGTRITHRIKDIRDGIICTCGDALLKPDEVCVSANQLVGRVVGRYRLGSLKPVQGGIKGRLLKGFYHYAGRLDPQRAARGGRAARLLRGKLQWLAGLFYRHGTVQAFGETDEEIVRYWLIGRQPWARFEDMGKSWLVSWPQSLLIDPARLPCQSSPDAPRKSSKSSLTRTRLTHI